MPRSITKKDYGAITEQFISAIGIVAVGHSLGIKVSGQIESAALNRPIFQMALRTIASIISINEIDSKEDGVLYSVEMPTFAPDMTIQEEKGFRAIFSNVLARSLSLKVTDFELNTLNNRAFALRVLEPSQQAILNRIASLNRPPSVSR